MPCQMNVCSTHGSAHAVCFGWISAGGATCPTRGTRAPNQRYKKLTCPKPGLGRPSQVPNFKLGQQFRAPVGTLGHPFCHFGAAILPLRGTPAIWGPVAVGCNWAPNLYMALDVWPWMYVSSARGNALAVGHEGSLFAVTCAPIEAPRPKPCPNLLWGKSARLGPKSDGSTRAVFRELGQGNTSLGRESPKLNWGCMCTVCGHGMSIWGCMCADWGHVIRYQLQAYMSIPCSYNDYGPSQYIMHCSRFSPAVRAEQCPRGHISGMHRVQARSSSNTKDGPPPARPALTPLPAGTLPGLPARTTSSGRGPHGVRTAPQGGRPPRVRVTCSCYLAGLRSVYQARSVFSWYITLGCGEREGTAGGPGGGKGLRGWLRGAPGGAPAESGRRLGRRVGRTCGWGVARGAKGGDAGREEVGKIAGWRGSGGERGAAEYDAKWAEYVGSGEAPATERTTLSVFRAPMPRRKAPGAAPALDLGVLRLGTRRAGPAHNVRRGCGG